MLAAASRKTCAAMLVSIDRKPHFYTTWFGLGKQREAGLEILVSVHFTELEREVIRRANLSDYVIYEDPQDLVLFQQMEENDRMRRSKLSAAEAIFDEMTSGTNPRYRNSRFVRHFMENPAQAIYPSGQDDLLLMSIEQEVEDSLRKLKNIIENVSSHPTGKRTIEL